LSNFKGNPLRWRKD